MGYKDRLMASTTNPPHSTIPTIEPTRPCYRFSCLMSCHSQEVSSRTDTSYDDEGQGVQCRVALSESVDLLGRLLQVGRLRDLVGVLL